MLSPCLHPSLTTAFTEKRHTLRDLVKKYVEKPSSIILAISAANSDLATSDALALAREVDPQGLRTVAWRGKAMVKDGGSEKSSKS